jgi:hypothetical protein
MSRKPGKPGQSVTFKQRKGALPGKHTIEVFIVPIRPDAANFLAGVTPPTSTEVSPLLKTLYRALARCI